MKKYCAYKLMLVVVMMILLCSCSKNVDIPEYTKFPAPVWIKDTTGKYSSSMTAVVSVSDDLRAFLRPDDQVGAFVNGECRGTGTLVSYNNLPLFYVLIQGNSSESANVSFKYYNSFHQNMFTSNAFLTFIVDGSFGRPDDPAILPLVVVQ